MPGLTAPASSDFCPASPVVVQPACVRAHHLCDKRLRFCPWLYACILTEIPFPAVFPFHFVPAMTTYSHFTNFLTLCKSYGYHGRLRLANFKI